MAKVSGNRMQGKQKTPPKSAEMTVPEDGTEREQRMMAIAMLAERGFDTVETIAEGEIQETESRDKETLVGVPLIVLHVRESTGDYIDKATGDYSKFFVVTCLPKDTGVVCVFTDGGAGIKEQLGPLVGKIDPRDPSTCVRAPGGLKFDDYTSKVTGEPARTWRLAKHLPKVLGGPSQNGRPRAQA